MEADDHFTVIHMGTDDVILCDHLTRGKIVTADVLKSQPLCRNISNNNNNKDWLVSSAILVKRI